jgi:Na+/H+-dicarboxylate symporter
MLPVVFFALVFGFAVSKVDQGQSFRLTEFFERLRDAMLVVVGWVLAAAPVGVFALAFVVGEKTGLAALSAFAHYLIVAIFMCFVAVAGAYSLAMLGGHVALPRFARAAAPAQAVAISTQSSMASLPAMIRACEGALAIPTRVTGVTLPLAVVLFRICGPVTAMTIAIYSAHVMNVPLGLAQLITGGAVAVVMVFATATGIPSQVLYMASLTPVLSTMGVPIEILGLLIAVEPFHDMFRTTANVTMDMALTICVAQLSNVEAHTEVSETGRT